MPSRHQPKLITRAEFEQTLGMYTSSYSDRYIYPPLPDAIAGVVNARGYLATFYSGSLAHPDGGIVGKLDMFREAMEVHCGDEGRVKKYSFNLFIPSDAELSGTIVAVQEVPPLNVGGHWAKEMDDEFLFHYINAPFGIPSKR